MSSRAEEVLGARERTMTTTDTYPQVIKKTTGMVGDRAVQRLAKKHGLHVLDITWEDTARFDDSAVGPNISDMTIQVQHQAPGREDYELSCMPVIRYPNFTDMSMYSTCPKPERSVSTMVCRSIAMAMALLTFTALAHSAESGSSLAEIHALFGSRNS